MRHIHQPVMVDEILKFIGSADDNIIVDCTIGEGGHSEYILKRLKPKLLLGIDRDNDILNIARERFKNYDNVKFINDDFSYFEEIIEREKIFEGCKPGVDAILLDLGLSLYQLKNDRLGLSFDSDSKLDMKFGFTTPGRGKVASAWEIVNRFSLKKIAEILWAFGEERWAFRIARAIITKRGKKKINSARELAELIKRVVPQRVANSKGRMRIHPATRTFQALRIVVNDELSKLNSFLLDVPRYLKIGGRIVVISYHSLEDRIVKQRFREYSGKQLRVLTKKPLVPDETERTRNYSSRSAKLRAAERI